MEENFYTTRGYEIQSYTNNLLTSSMEDYLEMIYRGYLADGYIRLSKLASLLNVKDSSASKMVQKIREIETDKLWEIWSYNIDTKGDRNRTFFII